MKPARIAEALQLNANTVRQTCTRMAKDGQLKAVPGGTYAVPHASDTEDTPQLSHLSLSHSTPSDQQEQE
jgi:predicted transcriptional regulator of viral defense system